MIPASGAIPAPTPHRALRSGRPSVAVALAGSLIVLVACAVAARRGLFDEPATVDLTVVNPTPYAVSVSVGDEGGEAWLSVGRIGPGAAREVRHVLDQGDRWTVRFHGQGHFAGELRRSRDELQAEGWRIEVPASVAEELQARGAPLSPTGPGAGAGGP